MAQWADIFPELDAHPTKDPRVFQTEWETMEKDPHMQGGLKKKRYFACVVNGTCYGVDVFKELYARDVAKAKEEAFREVLGAIDWYDEHGQWPII